MRIFSFVLASAFALNASIVPNSLIEENRKTVNAIYIQTWAVGTLGFSASDSAILFDIAMQDPLIGGDGVYGARVMIGIADPLQVNGKLANDPSNAISDEKLRIGKMYPNPNDGVMQFDYFLEDEQEAEMIIYDIFGKIMSSYPIVGNGTANTLKINGRDFQNGIYLYSLKVDGELIESDKIIIIK